MSSNLAVPDALERRRIGVFLVGAFGVSWLTALGIYLTGGLVDSRELVGGVTIATVLLPTTYMFGPAVGNVLARLATGEGRSNLRLRPRTEGTWPYYLTAWLLPAVLTALGGALYFLLYPAQFDPSMANFATQLQGMGVEMDVQTLLLIQVAAALTLGPAINALFAFGEEFGWRAYLLPKLLPLGVREAVLLHGVVWGVWHWPIIAMGYNYGFDYPGFPVTGLLAFLPFTVGVGTVLAWLTVREGSVWPASVAHGAVNAVAGITVLFLAGQPNTLVGPTPVGVVGGLPWLVLAGYLLWERRRLDPAVRSSDRGESPASAAGPEV
jgi:membrane protease YdiL (CAAX protease family)